MNWNEVYNWMESHGHVNKSWECIGIGCESFYAEDHTENTFISVFVKVSGELVVYVGMFHPNLSVGGNTGVYVNSIYDVLDWLHDNLEAHYEKLAEKFQ